MWRAPAYEVANYRELIENVARLSYANRNQLLFFRGQDKDYQSKAGGSTLYPTIYRGDNIPQAELDFRFRELETAARSLTSLFEKQRIEGSKDLARKRYIQWSVLQHYGVVATPLLDITHSLRVACSFAQTASTDSTCFVYVLGLPYATNRISINSEEDIVNIRLLSICPPSALRPHFQEGYMAGTPDVTVNFETKTEVDFRNRLVAKFAIPRAKRFWNSGFEAMPRGSLYPSGDRIEELCREVVTKTRQERSLTHVGQLLIEWAVLEERLLTRARQVTGRNVSVREAINALRERGSLGQYVANGLHEVRHVRNKAAHTPGQVEGPEIDAALQRLRDLAGEISEEGA